VETLSTRGLLRTRGGPARDLALVVHAWRQAMQGSHIPSEGSAPPVFAKEASMHIRRATWMAAVVVAMLAPTACDAGAPASPLPASGSPVDPTPGATTLEATATMQAPSEQPTPEPTAEPFVLAGSWVTPDAGARLTSYTTTLSARPTATGTGVTTFTRVVFSATWEGGSKKTACKATKPGKHGTWACKANLLTLGVPPGKVTFSFDVVGVGVPIARSPDGPRRITYAVKPPRPNNTRLQQIEQPDTVHGDDHPLLHRVRWSAPAGYADQFLVYETFECPRPSTRENSGKPCFVAGTPVDTTKLELRARAAGDATSVKIRLTEFECGPSHGTILLRARNANGASAFAIVEAAPIMWAPPGDIIC
jgi:hypothetical protein